MALAQMAGLFGFVGMLIAVPAAACIGVLVRFLIDRYLDSDLYYGSQRPIGDETAPPIKAASDL